MTTTMITRRRPTTPSPSQAVTARAMSDRDSALLWEIGTAYTALAEDLLNHGGYDLAERVARLRRLLADLLDARAAS